MKLVRQREIVDSKSDIGSSWSSSSSGGANVTSGGSLGGGGDGGGIGASELRDFIVVKSEGEEIEAGEAAEAAAGKKEKKRDFVEVARPLPCEAEDVTCSNGGICTNLNTLEWKCICRGEFKGKKCQEVRSSLIIYRVLATV